MASYEIERERFIVAMKAEGMPESVARRILRHANTVQRLAVDSCNGVREPRHYGETITQSGRHGACGNEYDDKSFRSTLRWADVTCPDCLSTRAERLIREWCDKASAPVCPYCGKPGERLAQTCGQAVPDDLHLYQCSGDESRREGDRFHRWSRRSFVPVFSGDPRGACVKLRVPSGKTDDWGQTGICVPTRRY